MGSGVVASALAPAVFAFFSSIITGDTSGEKVAAKGSITSRFEVSGWQSSAPVELTELNESYRKLATSSGLSIMKMSAAALSSSTFSINIWLFSLVSAKSGEIASTSKYSVGDLTSSPRPSI